ncbi:GntR family transcriptional regulator [Nocardioides aurantiacus]|uniref:DNA-binding transcriptional regulator YhcF (GntR family) n=1 Tax=Nocardioides aurantiacus TaxID=86796 RepID=A0A3N2CR11_9ACTN|nr:GntR family transcriptional regulator [Nocardioides aurantiacus]ROR89929.1 DNA-binding transcriptional regulator YhcF (GntR family) [Nocardioides aurantiacus]
MTDPDLVLDLDPGAPEPPYEQVREAIRAQVDDGTLRPGTRLPPVRRLAETLGLAAGTVARAYKELEAAGVIETRGRAGSVVTGGGVERAAREAATTYVGQARGLGLGDDEVLALVRRALRG